MDREVLGVDIGGTNIKVGRLAKNGLVQRKSIGVDPKETASQTLKRMFTAIDAVLTDSVDSLGIGVPGVVDTETGIVYDVQNIPSWKEVNLKEIVQQRYSLPVFINNDANCFVLGERSFGKAKHYSNCIGLSIGTGLGMGIIINERLYEGVLCGAGEIGMLGYQGSILEYYTGSFFFSNHYGSSAKELHDLARRGDKKAIDAFKNYGFHLGEALKNILYAYAPEAIILGGSISKSYPYFETAMNKTLKSFAYPKQLKKTKIETSNLEDSAILGAAALCLQQKEHLKINT